MGLVDRLSEFLARPQEETTGEVPDGVCPNCWGHYEWDGEIRRVARDRQIDINNGVARYAFVQDFVVKQIDGIRLRDSRDGASCPRCSRN